MLIDDELYGAYQNSLLKGDTAGCLEIVTSLLEKNIKIQELYSELFQKSMYKVGDLWALNEISVSREHLATAITESMLSVTYPYLFTGRQSTKKAIISCTTNEYHQLGGKMVADIFEVYGWDSHFLGVNTSVNDLLTSIDEKKPDLVGLSLAVYFNIAALEETLEAVYAHFSNVDILVGGQAFRWGGTAVLKKFPGANYLESLAQLETDL